MKRLLIFATIIFCGAAAAILPAAAEPADGDLSRSAPPSWVRSSTWSAKDNPGTSTGFVDRLIDYQVNLDTEELYVHIVYLISSTDALSRGSTITISFDPSYQNVTLHVLKRWRRGQALSQEGQEFRRIQREQGLEESLFSGVQSWVAFLKDVSVGDTVEASYTVRGFNPIFMGKYCDVFDLQGSSPVERWSLRVVYDSGRTPTFKVYNFGGEGKEIESGGRREYLLEAADLQAVDYEPSLPYGFQPGARVEVSEFDSWGEVASWGIGLYSSGESTEVRAEAQSLLTGIEGPEQKVLTLLEFVQDEIRYLGIETGMNSHQPHAAAEVLANRFGDCKDKAALFCDMARTAGIAAWPVLVRTWRMELVDQDLPSPLRFNHVIAAVELGGRLLFLDPTRSLQGGSLGQRVLGDFGWGLILRQGSEGLRKLPGPRMSLVEKTERFIVSDLSGPAVLEALYVFNNDAADAYRAHLSAVNPEDLRKEILEAFQSQYGGIKMTGDASISDDRAANRIELRLGFVIDNFVTTSEERKEIDLYPSLILERIHDPQTVSSRTQPMYFEHPITIIQHQIIQLPIEWRIDPAERKVEDPSFRLTSLVSSSGTTVRIETRFESLADRVEPENWTRFLGDLERSRRAVYWSIWKDIQSVDPEPTLAVFITMILIFILTALQMGGDY
jgi:hypothetical protein